MKTYFIADQHFGDANIIRYENRPFRTVEEMDRIMVERWNSIVNKEDRVYVLGDFSNYPLSVTKKIVSALEGEKILICGNHDVCLPEEYYECGFAEVSRLPVIWNEFWILSHQPMYINDNMPYANIFGHVHGNKIYSDYSAKSFCASVERIGYTPISLEAVWEKIKSAEREEKAD